MPFNLSMDEARAMFPEYDFISALPPSAQKAAFEVRDSDGQHLCLKVIAPDYGIDRLEREVLALQSLDHPNVARLIEYTFSTREGHQRHFVIEEFVEGSDLSASLVDRQPWHLNEVASVFGKLLDGLSEIHDLRIVHRDLKPSNIRMRNGTDPVIIDLGLARHLDRTDLTRTEEGAAIGTPAYFSPEQFSGTKHDIDQRTDLFAVGLLIYQAAVGTHPFLEEGMSYQNLKDAVLKADDYLSHEGFLALPAEWQLIVSKLLEHEKVKRPVSSRQVRSVLARIGGQE